MRSSTRSRSSNHDSTAVITVGVSRASLAPPLRKIAGTRRRCSAIANAASAATAGQKIFAYGVAIRRGGERLENLIVVERHDRHLSVVERLQIRGGSRRRDRCVELPRARGVAGIVIHDGVEVEKASWRRGAIGGDLLDLPYDE